MNKTITTTTVPTNTYAVGNVTWDPSYGSIERVFRQLPALFNESWFDQVFGDLDKAFDVPNAVYPYNVLATKNKDGEVSEYYIEVALAGVGRDSINVKVKDQKLNIEVDPITTLKSNEKGNYEEPTYLRRGISKRKGSLSFHLNEKVNAKKINSSYKDGLLIVSIPVVQPETIDVNIKVN